MLTCYIEGKNLNENYQESTYQIADGAVFIENYNETLDSGTIIIPHLDSKIDIEPYDVIVISGNNIITKRMCVDSFVCTQECISPAIYKYEIKLFSETKLLEGILCPSLAITKRANGTSLSVWDYIERYVDLYGTKIADGSDYERYPNKYTLGDSLNVFKNIDCPEMQWNEPTLREVLNDLMMVADRIPVIKNNVIECINIGSIGNEITNTQKLGINYIQESQSSTDYVSNIKMHLQNSANNTIFTPSGTDVAPDDSSKIITYIGFRNDGSYLLTTKNMKLQTNFPIWKIFACVVDAPIRVKFTLRDNTDNVDKSYDVAYYARRDLTPYILEYGEWLTKDVYYDDWNLGDLDLNANYRNRCLFYKRGSKDIENFAEYVEQQWLFIRQSKFVWEMIFTNAVFQQTAQEAANAYCTYLHEQDGHNYTVKTVPTQTFYAVNYLNARFQMFYEAMDDCVFSSSKSPLPTNKRTIVDNQTNSYIDISRQGLLEYAKANRLGNKIALVNARYEVSESLTPELGQKINDKIIFQKQIAVYDNHIDANYQCVDNYVLKDYFTGIKSKLRSWRIVDGNEALVRSEHIKFYFNDQISGISTREKVIPNYQTIDEYLENFKFCAIMFLDENGNSLIGNTHVDFAQYSFDLPTNAIMVEFTKHKIGDKSVIFTIKMKDNAYEGNYISKVEDNSLWDTIVSPDGGAQQKGAKYTDDNGEVASAVVYFYNNFRPHEMAGGQMGGNEANDCVRPFVSTGTIQGEPAYVIPQNFWGTDIVAKIPVKLWKDNKEILQISIQFELNDDADDILLGKK